MTTLTVHVVFVQYAAELVWQLFQSCGQLPISGAVDTNFVL